jgi:hypothetical protein
MSRRRRAQAEQHDPDRHVDQEDAAPGPVGDEQPAEQRADHPADREDAGEHADGLVPVRAELVGDDPGGGRHERAAADGLDDPQHDEQVDVVGEPAAQRGRGEQHHRGQEDLLAAELVADLPGQRHGQHLAEGVDGNGPAGQVDPGVQVVLERGQRGGDNSLID